MLKLIHVFRRLLHSVVFYGILWLVIAGLFYLVSSDLLKIKLNISEWGNIDKILEHFSTVERITQREPLLGEEKGIDADINQDHSGNTQRKVDADMPSTVVENRSKNEVGNKNEHEQEKTEILTHYYLYEKGQYVRVPYSAIEKQ